MAKKLAGLNGLERNIAKLKQEWKFLSQRPDGQVTDWLKKPWDLHAYVDIYVETMRASPYLMGHIYAVVIPAAICAITVLALR